MNIRFLIISVILFIIILVSEYIAYASLHHAQIIESKNLEIVLMTLGIILPILFIISMFYSYKYYSVFNSWVNTVSSVWLGITLYIFIASLIVFILIMLNYYFNLQMPVRIISVVLLIIVGVLVFYSIINSNNPRIVKWDVVSEKLSENWKEKKIIIISDVHLGSIRREKFLQKIIAEISKEKPDLVLIVGDLIDGSSIPYQKWLSNFSVLKPEMGILYVEGNHEKYSQEYSKFKSEFPSSITDLTNKKITINNTEIIGIDYTEAETSENLNNKLKSLNYDSSIPSIILKHDPNNIETLASNGVSLVISGHTHGGQLFPITSLVDSIYKKYAHGVTYTNKTASVTSYGVGSSLVPMRLGTVPEIVILNIK